MNTQRILFYTLALIIFFVASSMAQSADMDNPAPMYANMIDGEGDGKGETVYYYFTATKGDVKITVDAKTNNYSTPLRVSLMDEDGKELLPIYVVANDVGKREVATKRFVREQKILVKISSQDDKDVKLLTYRVKVDGAVRFETPPTPPVEVSAEQPATPVTEATPATEATPEQAAPPAEPVTDPTAEQPASSPKPKSKVKTKAKDAAKAALKSILDN